MALNKQAILAADDLQRQRVDVPEWAPTDSDPAEAFVWVRTLTLDECEKFSAYHDEHDGKGSQALLCMMGICDEAGARLFGDEEIAQLAGRSYVVVKRIANTVMEMSGLTAAAVEDEEKNSGDAQSSASNID